MFSHIRLYKSFPKDDIQAVLTIVGKIKRYMIAAAAMAAHSPSDAVISMFSKSYQYSVKINKLLLIPPNAVIDKQFSK